MRMKNLSRYKSLRPHFNFHFCNRQIKQGARNLKDLFGIAMWRDLNFVLIVVLKPGGCVVVLKPVSYSNTMTEVAAG